VTRLVDIGRDEDINLGVYIDCVFVQLVYVLSNAVENDVNFSLRAL
jgi:hypothetical protein